MDAGAVLARLGRPVRRITSDSRVIAPGDAFAAYPGETRDGRAFIPEAMRRGAGGVLWETEGFTWPAGWATPNAGVANLKQELGFIADHLHGHPSRQLWTVGVTGTNGKTSCAHWIAQALTALGRNAAVAGTLGNGMYGSVEPALNTTPDAAALHWMLRRWIDAGAQSVAMEVSSHGLLQGRVNGVEFDVALFTNLTRDHLDYHRTMDAYGAAKARLFAWPALKTAVINAEDAFGQQLITACRGRGQSVLTYGRYMGDITTRNLGLGINGIAASVVTPWGKAELASGLLGSFNVSNLLGVLGVLLASDVPLDMAMIQLARLEPVAGRMQKVGGGGRPLVVVDYAHTPDALEQVLGALRPVADSRNGRLVAVFGCGGDRDPGKRPQMGAIASRLADKVVVTSDNPRGEDPAAIIEQVAAGTLESKARIERIAARDAAIAGAIAEATENDTILIAGKGHEAYQEIAGVRQPFSDLDHARTALAAWRRP
ncbi:MAG: UDP-N-acetylmuramoyl-L-alanyl-D-glutamate--2,6-diaminopimelate ligase [Betaproteobacteria bacterium]|nr:UDP-N-acetylmuramoyl-L-alanyl-D-glutamate--2,6-diaminopimelate ligase [Betaproteobacteria bacterium]